MFEEDCRLFGSYLMVNNGWTLQESILLLA